MFNCLVLFLFQYSPICTTLCYKLINNLMHAKQYLFYFLNIRSINMKLEFALTDNIVITKLRYWCQKSLLTSHKHFRLRTIQVSYDSIVCNSVEHVEFYAWKLRFADSIDFLLPFEENCCRIASNACRSLRWACPW